MLFLKYFSKINFSKFGFLFFNTGLLLLFSAPALSSFFLVLSLFQSIFLIKKNPIHDKINIILILVSILMLSSCFIFQINNQEKILEFSSGLNTHPLVGLINWIPLFLSYLGFQYYLKTEKDRLNSGICLIFSSIPILVTGFGQYLFNWYGPIEFFNGLIIWYQRANTTGMTGLFNNPNYTSCVLATILPLFFALFFKIKTSNLKRLLSLILIIFVILGIIFTSSRNGLLGLILGTFIFLMPLRLRLFSLGFLSFGSIFIFNFIFKLIFNISIFPLNLVKKLSLEGFFNDYRITIWKNAINYIYERPFLGWGGNGFSTLWNNESSLYLGHSHSIPIEIAIQYGIFTSILLLGFITFILGKSFSLVFLDSNLKLINSYKQNFFDRAWFSSCLVLLFSNIVDIVYFDIRVSILFWVLLAGLRNIRNYSLSN